VRREEGREGGEGFRWFGLVWFWFLVFGFWLILVGWVWVGCALGGFGGFDMDWGRGGGLAG